MSDRSDRNQNSDSMGPAHELAMRALNGDGSIRDQAAFDQLVKLARENGAGKVRVA